MDDIRKEMRLKYEDEHKSRLWDKIKEDPFVPIGFVGMLGTIVYGAMQYRNRGNISTSMYVLRFRIFAQGAVVGSMAIGVGYRMASSFWKNYNDRSTGS